MPVRMGCVWAYPGPPRRTGSPVPTQRLPLLNYDMVKDQMLRDKLAQYGLPTHGGKKALAERHQDFVHRFNAETDSANPRCPLLRILSRLWDGAPAPSSVTPSQWPAAWH
jgi:E3 ubiquitin-protein ligase RAD18